MALHWDITKCENSDSLTTDEQWPVTRHIIWATMFVGMGRITEENIETFAKRVMAHDKVAGPFLSRWDDDGKKEDYFPGFEEIRKYIGLSTNVTTISDDKFYKKLGQIAVDYVAWNIHEFKRKESINEPTTQS